MKQPCEYGFNCPYRAYDEDMEILCTYPYIRIEDGEPYGYACEKECALMDYDSELYDILLAYQESEKIQNDVESVIRIIDEDNKKTIDEFRKRRLQL